MWDKLVEWAGRVINTYIDVQVGVRDGEGTSCGTSCSTRCGTSCGTSCGKDGNSRTTLGMFEDTHQVERRNINKLVGVVKKVTSKLGDMSMEEVMVIRFIELKRTPSRSRSSTSRRETSGKQHGGHVHLQVCGGGRDGR